MPIRATGELASRRRRASSAREQLGRVLGDWPIWLHRVGLGRLVGRRYAIICSIGRRTGHARRAGVMVLREDRRTGELLVVAGSRTADWYRNVCAAPASEVWTARGRFHPAQRLLGTDEIAQLLLSIRQEHPREARVQAMFFGWPWPATPRQLHALATSLGGVGLRPEPTLA